MQKEWRQTATRTSDGVEESASVSWTGRVEESPSRDSRRGEEEVESNVGLGAALGRLQPSQGPGCARQSTPYINWDHLLSSAAHPARPAPAKKK